MTKPVLVIIVVLLLVALFALLEIINHHTEPERCRAKRASYRCVHEQDHPGSHRDEYGDYWN